MSRTAKATQARWENAERIEAEKQAILDYLEKYGRSGYNDIQANTGIPHLDLSRRIMKLRNDNKITLVGRMRTNGQDQSHYELATNPGANVMPPHLVYAPPIYLTWGGYTA